MNGDTPEEGCNCVNCRLARIEAKLDKAFTPDRAVILKAVEAALGNVDGPMNDKHLAKRIVDEIMDVI